MVKRIETKEDLAQIAGAELGVAKSKSKIDRTVTSKNDVRPIHKSPKGTPSQPNQKSNTKKKGKKAYSTQKTFDFFNEASKETMRETLVAELNKIADQYGADHIDLDNSPSVPELFSDPFWSWRSTFFIKHLDYAEKYKDDNYANRYWLDCLIRQCGYMIWNLVQKHHMNIWRETGAVPENSLSRKLRKNIDAVSDDLAEKEVATFEENFK